MDLAAHSATTFSISDVAGYTEWVTGNYVNFYSGSTFTEVDLANHSSSAFTISTPGISYTDYTIGNYVDFYSGSTFTEVDLANHSSSTYTISTDGYTEYAVGTSYQAIYSTGTGKLTEVDLAAHSATTFSISDVAGYTEWVTGNYVNFYSGSTFTEVDLANHSSSAFTISTPGISYTDYTIGNYVDFYSGSTFTEVDLANHSSSTYTISTDGYTEYAVGTSYQGIYSTGTGKLTEVDLAAHSATTFSISDVAGYTEWVTGNYVNFYSGSTFTEVDLANHSSSAFTISTPGISYTDYTIGNYVDFYSGSTFTEVDLANHSSSTYTISTDGYTEYAVGTSYQGIYSTGTGKLTEVDLAAHSATTFSISDVAGYTEWVTGNYVNFYSGSTFTEVDLANHSSSAFTISTPGISYTDYTIGNYVDFYSGSTFTEVDLAGRVLITTTALPTWTANAGGYHQTIAASDGTAPYTFTLGSGTLPTGMTLTTGGLLSGTPTAPGTYNFTINAADSAGSASGSQAYSVTINPALAISTTTLPNWTINQPYTQSIAVTGGTSPDTFALSAGNLPTGLALNTTTGAITGTPTTTAGSPFSFTVTATDAAGATFRQAYYVAINTALAISATTLPNWTINQPYTQSVGVTGGTSPDAFALSAGSLPIGLALNASTGAITGTPTTTAGSPFNFTVTATDAAGATSGQAYSVTINPALSISPTNLLVSTPGSLYNATITVTGGTTPYTSLLVTAFNAGITGFAATNITTNAGNGNITIIGTPTTPGSASFTVTATDSAGATVTQNFILTVFGVESAVPTASGVVLTFNASINPASTVLYSSPGDTTLGAADVAVTGPNGPVRGSLVIDPTNLNEATFVQSNGLLASGTYTLTVTNAVQASDGAVISGTYTTTMTVTAPTTPVLSLPSFARGPGQSVAMTDTLGNTTGIPVNIIDAMGATQASFTLTYDPTLLTIDNTGALTLSSVALAAGINTINYSISNVDGHHSVLTVSLTSNGGGSGLPTASAETLVTIAASVPTTAPYLNKALLNLGNVLVNGTSAAAVSGVDENAYVGNVSGSGSISALDASLVNQVGAGSGTGFSAFKDLDPAIIGGVSGDSAVSALDASLINQAGSGTSISQIPSVPTGITPITGGPDPYLYLSSVQGSAGQMVTETLYLDVTDPNGVQLSALDEAIGFNASALQVSDVRVVPGLAGLGSYATIGKVNNQSGVLLVGQAFAGSGLPPVVPYGTDVPVLEFNVTLNSDMTLGAETGLTLLQDGTINGQTKFSAVSDNEGALTWTPGMTPSNSGNAAIDGTVTVVAATTTGTPKLVAITPRSEVILPTIIEPVRRVTPVQEVAGTRMTAVSLLVPTATDQDVPSVAVEVTTTTSEPVVASSNLGASPALTGPSVVSVVTAPMPVSTAQSPVLTNGTSNPTKASDPGASLSLVVVGTNTALPSSATIAANVKSATNVLDELYHQLTMGGPQASTWSLGASSSDTEDMVDPWYLEILLGDPDRGRPSMDRDLGGMEASGAA